MSLGHYFDAAGTPLVLHSPGKFAAMTDAEFFEFCRVNRDWRIERSAEGDLNIMPPTGGEGGRRSTEVIFQLKAWSDRDGTGIAFDSSTGFLLRNGAVRSPDSSWVLRERWQALSKDAREKFPPLAPDFVIEVRSKTDRLVDLQDKLQEYVDNGVRLGWLIDPTTRRVEVYRPGTVPVSVDNPTNISADPELPGFVLRLETIW